VAKEKMSKDECDSFYNQLGWIISLSF
jgi:hypothetical protein